MVHSPKLNTLILSCANLFELSAKFKQANDGSSRVIEVGGELLYDDGNGVFRPQFLSLRALERNVGEDPDIVERWESATPSYITDTNEAEQVTAVKHLMIDPNLPPSIGAGEEIGTGAEVCTATAATNNTDYNRFYRH